MKVLKSVEMVGRGHPDKIADLISDSILDDLVDHLGINQTRFSGEVLVSAKKIFFAGEGSTYPGFDTWSVIQNVLKKLNYSAENFNFFEDYKAQSPELFELNNYDCKVAGDQGIVFGFASNQTPHYLPFEYVLSKEIFLELSEVIERGSSKGLREDFKLLINLEIDQDKLIGAINNSFLKTIVLSIHHDSKLSREKIELFLKHEVIIPILQKYRIAWGEETQWLMNPSGSFLIGGLSADSGVTNRKQLIDSYGVSVRHGGGGLSGKDLTKIDRLGAYYLRWITKNIVAAGLASELEIKATFSIAQDKALSFDISHSMSCKLNSSIELNDLIETCFPIKISEIFSYLTSSKFLFSELCERSHFGNFVPDLPWEKLNKVTDIDGWFRKFKGP